MSFTLVGAVGPLCNSFWPLWPCLPCGLCASWLRYGPFRVAKRPFSCPETAFSAGPDGPYCGRDRRRGGVGAAFVKNNLCLVAPQGRLAHRAGRCVSVPCAHAHGLPPRAPPWAERLQNYTIPAKTQNVPGVIFMSSCNGGHRRWRIHTLYICIARGWLQPCRFRKKGRGVRRLLPMAPWARQPGCHGSAS